MNLNLNDKKILVIGASKGIGKSVVLKLAEENAQVVAVARTKELLIELKKEFDDISKTKLNISQYDVTKNSDFIANELIKIYGSFDCIVHCVGTSLTSRNLLDTKDAWINCLNINALHAISMNSIFINDMIKNQINGHILHVSSISADNLRGNSLYSCSKLFLNGYIKCAGREFAKNNIIINGVMPGAVKFENSYWDILEKENNPKVNDFLQHHQSVNRFGTTDEIASLICFLISDLASFTSGCVMPIDGGSM